MPDILLIFIIIAMIFLCILTILEDEYYTTKWTGGILTGATLLLVLSYSNVTYEPLPELSSIATVQFENGTANQIFLHKGKTHNVQEMWGQMYDEEAYAIQITPQPGTWWGPVYITEDKTRYALVSKPIDPSKAIEEAVQEALYQQSLKTK